MSKKSITLDDLALMMKQGFDSADKRFDQVEERLTALEQGQAALEQGQEEIKLRLTNVAYRFEVEDLARRVTALERRASVNQFKSK